MDQGVSVIGADERRPEPGTFDVGQFAQSIRRLAIEAHEILNHPGAVTGELAELRRRLKELLRVPRGSRLIDIARWLRSTDRMLAARLPCAHMEGDFAARIGD